MGDMDTVLLKYHCLGNDYLVYDTCKNNIELDGRAIRTICARNFGLGTQGILAGPVVNGGNIGVKIYRPDGSEAGINRNAVKIFQQYLKDAGYGQPFALHAEEEAVEQEKEGEDAAAVGKLFLTETFMNRNHIRPMENRA